MTRAFTLMFTGLLAVTQSAFAQDHPSQHMSDAPDGASSVDKAIARDAKAKEDVGDPNRVICRNVDTIGSRLSTKKFCATAAEWAARKAEQREGTERVQTNRWKSE